MEKQISKPAFVIIGAILFNLIFWNEKQGLNTLIFDLFIIATLWKMDNEPFSTPSVKITIGGTLLAAVLIVWHNSILVKFIHILSFATMIGLIQQREFRFLVFACFQYFSNWLATPLQLFSSLENLPLLKEQKNIVNRVKGILLTLLIFPIFFLIYYTANAKFAELSRRFLGNIFDFFTFDINIERILFFILGIFIVGATVFQQKWVNFLKHEKTYSDTLVQPEIIKEDESSYRNALNLVIALNALLLINNVIDIRYVWFADVSGKTALALKEYVHEGTYLLIYGILLAILIILWLFKGGLNFEENMNKKPSILRGATTAWLVQNAILALSVGIRNGQYINHYGLAYKRIGVFVFLVLTIYGLFLLYLKIKEKRTFFFFIRRSVFGLYAVLLATCLVNWDIFITNFNIHYPSKSGQIDVRFLVEDVSDKNIYLLFQNAQQLAPKIAKTTFPDDEYRKAPKLFANDAERLAYLTELLNNKKKRFEEEQKGYSWLSWNHADDVNKEFFK